MNRRIFGGAVLGAATGGGLLGAVPVAKVLKPYCSLSWPELVLHEKVHFWWRGRLLAANFLKVSPNELTWVETNYWKARQGKQSAAFVYSDKTGRKYTYSYSRGYLEAILSTKIATGSHPQVYWE